MARARTGVRAGAALCGPLAVALTAGCGAPQPGEAADAPPRPRPDARARMEQVATAWEGSPELRQWREGHHSLNPQGEAATPPVPPLEDADGGTARLFGLRGAPGATTTVGVTAGQGSCDGGVTVDVLEGVGTVVRSGRILPGAALEPGGGCDAMLHTLTVEVALSRPVGDRIVVDAATGRALEHGQGG